MDAFYSTSSAYGAAASGWGYDSLKNFRQISPAVQSHLKLVRFVPPSPSSRECFFFWGFFFVGVDLVRGVAGVATGLGFAWCGMRQWI